jgi:hypothetical protein
MTNFESLPNEILLILIELFCPDSALPVVGYNAVWVNSTPSFTDEDKVPTHSGVTIRDQGFFLTELTCLQQ